MLPSRFITNNFLYVSLASWGFWLFHAWFLRIHYLPVSMVISQWYVSISALADSLLVFFLSWLLFFFLKYAHRETDWDPEHSSEADGLALAESDECCCIHGPCPHGEILPVVEDR